MGRPTTSQTGKGNNIDGSLPNSGSRSQGPAGISVSRQIETHLLKAATSEYVEGGWVYYIVKPGDNIFLIEKRFNISRFKIIRLNSVVLSDPGKIYPGQKLRIRRANKSELKGFWAEYKIAHGDTLIKISKRFNISSAEIMTWNSLIENRDSIQEGEILRLNIDVILNRITSGALWDFILGNVHEYSFESSHPWTIRLREHPHMNKVRELIKAELSKHCANQGGSTSGNLNFSLNDLTLCETIVWLGKDIISWDTGGEYGQDRAFIFGSFRLKWAASEINCESESKATAEINFYASDVLHLQSALRIPLTNIGPEDEPFGKGKPLHNVLINWSWSEKI